MTPPVLDAALVHAKLRAMRELLDDLEAAGHVDAYRESFALAVEAGGVPRDLAERLAPSAGLRDVLVHEYAQVDLALVAHGVELARTDYRAYVREVARSLQG